MMKPSILLVGNFLSSQGGNLTIAEELALYFERAGDSIVTTSSMRSRLLRLLNMLFTVYARRTDYEIVLVSVFSGPAFLWAEMVSRLLELLRKPYILSLHGGELPAFASRWSGRVKRLLQNANMVTAPSPYLQTAMRSYREDIVLVPNPLDLQNYPFRLRSMPKPHLVWLRAFHNIYNPQMAPLLIANLLPSFPEITLTMIGPDKGDGSLQATQTVIEELGLQNHIRIMPGIPKNEVSAYLGCADIFINTTNVDNTPVSVLEAMACGLCVVSTDVGGIPDLLDAGQDALLVPPNNPETMTNAIKRILTESGLAAWLSANAGKKAAQFDWPTLLPKWESVFEKTIQTPNPMTVYDGLF